MTQPEISQRLDNGESIRCFLADFPSIDAAYQFLAGHASRRFSIDPSSTISPIEIQWVAVYQNRKSALLTLLIGLPFILFGRGPIFRMECKFTTYHHWQQGTVKNIAIKNRLFELLRHGLFGISVIVFLALFMVAFLLSVAILDHKELSIYWWLSLPVLTAIMIIVIKVRFMSYMASLPKELRFLGASRCHPIMINKKRA